MKKTYTTEAINLKNYPLNDDDSIVTMFSKTRGLVSAVARGSKRPKSKLGARIQMFIANKLLLSEGRNLDTISEAQSLNTFSKIRYDLDKLSYSMYIAELVNTFCSKFYNSDENTSYIYTIIFKVYEHISSANSKREVLLYTIKFLMKFMEVLGWGLDFENCSTCQKELPCCENVVFSYEAGGFLCSSCAQYHTFNTIRIHNKIKTFLSTLAKSEFDEKTPYDDIVTENILDKCFGFLKKYIDNLTNKKTKVFEVMNKVGI